MLKKPLTVGIALLAAAAAPAALAGPISVDHGTLVDDKKQDLTWVSNGNLFLALADASGNPNAYVNMIVADSGGAVDASQFETTGVSAGMMTWFAAQAWVNYLDLTRYMGYSNWRLPTTVDSLASIGYPNGSPGNPSPSSSEMAYLFYEELGQVAGSSLGSHPGPFHDVQATNSNSQYWSTLLEPYNAFEFSPWNGYQGNSFSLNGIAYVLPVRGGLAFPEALPEPGTLWLELTGLAGIGWTTRRRVSRWLC